MAAAPASAAPKPPVGAAAHRHSWRPFRWLWPARGDLGQHRIDQSTGLNHHLRAVGAQRAQDELGNAGGDIFADAPDDGVGIADGEIAGRVVPGSPPIGLNWSLHRRGIDLPKVEGEAGTVVILVNAASLRRG